MEGMTEQTTGSQGPKNRSLEAYKAWMHEAARRLFVEVTTIELTDEEWVAYWEEYWSDKAGD